MLLSTVLFSGLAAAASIPSNNGFPNPNQQQMQEIAKQAGGLIPNVELPKELGPGSTTAFQLIAFNELFETAFFGDLINNITTEAPGYEAQNKDELLKIFKTVLAVRPTSLSLPLFCHSSSSIVC